MTNGAGSAAKTRGRFGPFEFDFRTDELRRNGETVKLSPQPCRVLGLLLARPGEVVLREELRNHLWGNDTFVDFERGLNFCILQVRNALADSSDHPKFIQTVPRKGYRFIAPVEILDMSRPATAAPVAPIAPAHRTAPDAPVAPVPWLLAAAIVLAPLLLFSLGPPRSSPAPSDGRLRVAVLPFVNLTGDASASYLADGLTDDLIAQLGRMGGSRLAVVARTSAMAYRESKKTIAEIGRELKAAYVVEGSIRRDGNTLRIGSNLVPTADESPSAVWSEAFDAADGEPQRGPSNATIRLARLIAIELLPDARAGDLPHSTSSPAA